MQIASEKFNNPFAKNLRKLIAENNTTIKAVADNIGITRQAVSQYCDGHTQPNADNIIKIAKFFNVSADYLLGLSDITSADVEIQDMCKKIGCTEEVLEKLIMLYDHSKFVDEQPSEQLSKTVDLLNKFLLYPGIWAFLRTIKKAVDEKKSKGMHYADKRKEIKLFELFLSDEENKSEYDDRIDAFLWRSQQCMSEIVKYLTTLDENTEKQISAYKANMEVVQENMLRVFREIDDPEKQNEFSDKYFEFLNEMWSVSVEDAVIKSSELIHWLETVYKSIKGELNENAEE